MSSELVAGPVLSICVPTYNRTKWLTIALRLWLREIEALEKDLKNQVELIVVDNASTDATPEVVAEARNWGAFAYYRNPTNIGMIGNLSECTKRATGKHIWVVGDDDLPFPGIVSRVLATIHQNPEVGYIFVNYATWHPAPEVIPQLTAIDLSQIPTSGVGNSIKDSGLFPRAVEIIAGDHNCSTNIYVSVFRADQARKAYVWLAGSSEFEALQTTAPHAVYFAYHLAQKPGYYLAEPGILTSVAALWHGRFGMIYSLQYLPELVDHFVKAGAPRRLFADHYKKLLKFSGPLLWGVVSGEKFAYRENFSFRDFIKRNWRYAEFYTLPFYVFRQGYWNFKARISRLLKRKRQE